MMLERIRILAERAVARGRMRDTGSSSWTYFLTVRSRVESALSAGVRTGKSAAQSTPHSFPMISRDPEGSISNANTKIPQLSINRES